MRFKIDRKKFLETLRTAYAKRTGIKARVELRTEGGYLAIAYVPRSGQRTRSRALLGTLSDWVPGAISINNARGFVGWVRDCPWGEIEAHGDEHALRMWSREGDFAEFYGKPVR